jgi:Xaa-Pro aminopeptidase
MDARGALTERYAARRKRLVEQVGSGVILIDSSGVSPDTLLWDKNLTYLTGVSDRNACLLLVPDGVMVEHIESRTGPELMRGRKVHEILFVEERSEQRVFMEGPAEDAEVLRQDASVERVYGLSQMNEILERALWATDSLWLNTPSVPDLDEPPTPALLLINRLRERFYWIAFRNVAGLIHQMRFAKDDYEIASLRQAFEIQTEIFAKIMRTLRPGDNESLARAIFDYEIQIRPGNVSHGMGNDLYEASIIVGAGKNSAVPHYMANNQDIQDGDLVLIDSGLSVNGYCSDITRTFPANGRFTPRQRELYAAVLEAQYAAIDTMKPGSTMLDAHQAVYDVFKKYDLARFSYGNCGHPVGLNIHDPNGRYPDDREQPFEPGVVIVIEPFLTIPEENMGIRIEDGVLITAQGHEELAGPPKEIAAVEELCRKD